MNTLFLRWSVRVFVVGTLTGLSTACVLSDGGYGYGYDDGGGYGAAYYEPYGVEYGGWGPGYHVAPFRGGGDHRPIGGGGHEATHAFRSAPASRSVPSLPAHGGGGRGGGARGGGGGGRDDGRGGRR